MLWFNNTRAICSSLFNSLSLCHRRNWDATGKKCVTKWSSNNQEHMLQNKKKKKNCCKLALIFRKFPFDLFFKGIQASALTLITLVEVPDCPSFPAYIRDFSKMTGTAGGICSFYGATWGTLWQLSLEPTQSPDILKLYISSGFKLLSGPQKSLSGSRYLFLTDCSVNVWC